MSETTTEGAATAPASIPAPTPAPAPGAPPEAPKATPEPDWKAEARKWEARAKENRTAVDGLTARASTAEQERAQLLDGIASALGIKKDDAPPDPQVLQQTLGEREGRIQSLEGDVRARDLELAAWRAASAGGANAAALLDSRSFVTQLAKLDPAADDFTAQLNASVKAALEANQSLRATPIATPGQAGIGVAGGTGNPIADLSGRELLRMSIPNTP